MNNIDKQIGVYRVISDNTRNGQLYKNTEDAEMSCVLVGQWYVINDEINIEYDFIQDIDCVDIVREALADEA